ncbi:replication initiator protein A [Massiliimalia massiliensis]|uniref:replication initiator protein A n=1 Tax=Massiliimalia massiliensis TaxID=1852384 RepID=UPI0009858EB8|nr:replication initiator protein A [Massiliimalia massiliensis]
MIERTYRISDIVKDDFLRFPITLLANPKYKKMSLEAKFVYSLLLNRLTLSQKNGWINEDKEVFLIYTREEAAKTLNISYKKAIAAFKELIRNGLLYEQRQGRGFPNLLYVLKAELQDSEAEEFSKEFGEASEEMEQPEQSPEQTSYAGSLRPSDLAHLHIPFIPFKICPEERSKTVQTGHQDMPKIPPRKNDDKKIKSNQIENSPSVYQDQQEELNDSQILQKIYQKCELDIFQPHIQSMFKNIIDRLYYSEFLKVGNAVLPQEKVRSQLSSLEPEVLINILEAMKENKSKIVNPTAYLMSAIFNGISEKESSLILSLPSEYQSVSDFYIPDER